MAGSPHVQGVTPPARRGAERSRARPFRCRHPRSVAAVVAAALGEKPPRRDDRLQHRYAPRGLQEWQSGCAPSCAGHAGPEALGCSTAPGSQENVQRVATRQVTSPSRRPTRSRRTNSGTAAVPGGCAAWPGSCRAPQRASRRPVTRTSGPPADLRRRRVATGLSDSARVRLIARTGCCGPPRSTPGHHAGGRRHRHRARAAARGKDRRLLLVRRAARQGAGRAGDSSAFRFVPIDDDLSPGCMTRAGRARYYRATNIPSPPTRRCSRACRCRRSPCPTC